MSPHMGGRSLLLFAEVFLLWQVTNYAFDAKLRSTPNDTPRPDAHGAARVWWLQTSIAALTAGVITGAVAEGHRWVWLSILVSATSFLLPVLRRFVIPRGFLAELELGTGLLSSSAAAWWIMHNGLSAAWTFEMQPVRLAAYCVVAGLLVFCCEGGSLIVVGVLARGGTLPPRDEDEAGTGRQSVRVELKHGQIIGMIERLTLALLIANGQFQSMAFFFAAKGLIRSKELEKRTWSDYLLLGSLTSFLTALVAGLLMNQVLQWR